jgi:hypothetical protein
MSRERQFLSGYHMGLMALGAVVAMSAPLAAQQGGTTKVGVLRCQTAPAVGLVVGSHQRLRCDFTPDNGGVGESYTGHINRLGVDVGVKGGGVMTWAVIAPTTGVHAHALAGKYVGATGDVSLGLGAGAKVLVGGSHRTVTLQPLSVEGQVGVNLALGVAGLTLRPSS